MPVSPIDPGARSGSAIGAPRRTRTLGSRPLLALGPRVVVLTGGHRARAADLFLDSADPRAPVSIEGVRHPDGAAHGSGCTHSSVLAARLALDDSPLDAARAARALAGEAVAGGLRDLGAGAGPVDVIGLARVARVPCAD
jgi:hydroxymethylpyrimidine/phosphomethylpyrimidine kinase